jgi:hypothetical protein
MVVDIKTVNAKAKEYATLVRYEMPVNKAYLFCSYARGEIWMQRSGY